MIEVIPAIIPHSFDDLVEHVARVRGLVSRVQIDVANGSYAPTHTWPYASAEHFDDLKTQSEGLPFWEEVDYEVDFLLRTPEDVIDEWIGVGIAAAIIHTESTKVFSEVSAQLRDFGVSCGLGIRPSTDIERVFENAPFADFVQHMGSDDIGFHGVSLDERTFERIAEIRERLPEIPISVDIGVNEETAPLLIDAGANRLVSGSAIFDAVDIRTAIQSLSGEEKV